MTKIRKSSKAPIRRQPSFRNRRRYSSIKINGFRLFESIDLKKLSNINLFFGPNNSGKSSLLEAIFAHACGRNLSPLFSQIISRRTNGFIRGMFDQGEQLFSLFNNRASLPLKFLLSAKLQGLKKSYNHKVEFFPSEDLSVLDPRSFGQSLDISTNHLRVVDFESYKESYKITPKLDKHVSDVAKVFLGKLIVYSEGKKLGFDLYFPPLNIPAETPFMFGTMIGLLDHRDPTRLTSIFSHLKRYEVLEEFSHEMNLVFPEVVNIDSVPFPDGSHTPLYITTTDGHKLPISAFGDGVCRWFLMLGEIIIKRRSTVCIEEIDSSFHPTSHRPLSQKLYEYALKYGAQLFLSSHSHEFVDTFLETLYGDEGVVDPQEKDPTQVFTLKRSDSGKSELWEITGREAFEQRNKYKLELMG